MMGHLWDIYPIGGTISGCAGFGHKFGMSKSDYPSVHLRVPPRLLKQVKIACAENDRSMNAEILARLERSFAAEDQDRVKAVKLLTDALSLLDKGRKG